MANTAVRPLIRPARTDSPTLQRYSASRGGVELNALPPLDVGGRAWFGSSPDDVLEPRRFLRNPPPQRYVDGLETLRDLLAPRLRQAQRRPPRGRQCDLVRLLWLTVCFGVLLREHVGWLAGDFRPETISRYLGHPEYLGLVQVLNGHRLERGSEVDRGGGATAFVTATEAGHAWLEEQVGSSLHVPRPLPIERLTHRPGRAGRLMVHDQRVAGWVLAYLYRTSTPAPWVRTPATDEGRFRPALERGRVVRERRTRPYDELVGRRLAVGSDLLVMDPGLDRPDRHEIRPDAVIMTAGGEVDPPVDLFVEFQTAAYRGFADKLARYDAFLAGWYRGLERYEDSGRPIVVVVAPRARLPSIIRVADQALRIRFRYLHSPRVPGFYPGREHVLFCDEADLYRGSLRAWTLPPVAPGDPGRERAAGPEEVSLVARPRY